MSCKNKNTFSFFLFSLSFFFLSSFIFTLSSCRRSTEPIYNPQNLKLQVMDVSCTEAWLSLKAQNDYLNKTLRLFQNDSLKLEKPLTANDSLLCVDGLWPNTSYRFTARVYEGEKLLAQSAAVTAATMDTTSHNFTWQTFEFGGQGGSSSFYDVAIIDEDDIWAVGEIYTADGKYNAAHWDGEKWELKKLDWDGYVSGLTCVYAFSSNDVWFGVTNLIHWNGNRFEKNINPVLNQFYDKTVNKIWGTSDHDLYIVGNSGLIAHYDGRKWQRIESGTNLTIQDIWGIEGQQTGEDYILCPASYKYELGEKKLLKIENNLSVIEENWPYPDRRIHSIWFKTNKKLFVCGAGVFTRNRLGIWIEYSELPLIFTNRIRGNENNDIFVAGDFGLLAHFNGLKWFIYKDAAVALFLSMDFKNNRVVAVGGRNRKAVILMMQRK